MNLSEWYIQQPSENNRSINLTDYEISSFPDIPVLVILSIFLYDFSDNIE